MHLILCLIAVCLLLVQTGCATHGCSNSRVALRKSIGSPTSTATQIEKRKDTPAIATVNYDVDAPEPFTESNLSDRISGEIVMTVGFLERLALAQNPAIKQACAAASKATGFYQQVSLKPNPRIGYFSEEVGNEGASGLHGAFFSQTVVTGAKLEWNRRVLADDVQAVLWQAEVQRYRVRSDVRSQFYRALAAQRRIVLGQEFREVAEKGVRIAEERLHAQLGSQPDILQSEIQLAEVDLEIQKAKLDFDAAWSELATVVGLPELLPSSLAGELRPSIVDHEMEAVYAGVVAQSPLIKSACARLRRTRSNLRRQQLQSVPNLTGQFGVGHDNSTGDEFANVQLRLPLPIHNWNQGNVRAAYAEYYEATQNVERIKLGIRRDLVRVLRTYQAARVTVQRFESSILPKLAESMRLIQEAQDAGEYNFLRVLTTRRSVFDANLQYVVALAELAEANVQIEGLLLSGGLSNVVDYDASDELRDQALNGQ